jgi:hypothetical protein
MALTPSPDNTRGEIALWVGEREAARVRELLAGLGIAVSAPSAPEDATDHA